MKVGETVRFGAYDWRVLEVKENAALIITEQIVGQSPYHNKKENVYWSNSSIRSYLNSEFYSTFSEAEQKKIIECHNVNKANPWYGSDGGEDTYDKIFLLSLEEAVLKYFGNSRQCLENRSPKQRYWFQKKDINNPLRRSSYDGYIWWWWLRTPGRDNRRAIYIHGDGNIGIQGNGTYKYSSNTIHPRTMDNSGGIRPVLWLNIGS